MKEWIEMLFMPASQVAMIIGIAELFKTIGLKKKWIPVLDFGLGLLSGIGIYGIFLGYGIVTGIVVGVGFGLSACGLFSGIKNLKEVKS